MSVPLRPARSREIQLLTEAHRARSRGRSRAAIRLYKRILIENPHNFEVALRVAPMLARHSTALARWICAATLSVGARSAPAASSRSTGAVGPKP